MSVEVKRVGPGDMALFARVAPEVFDDPIEPVRLSRYLANPRNLMLLAMSGDEAVGQVMGVIHQYPDKLDELYVDELGVTPSFRRQGVARRLMQALLALGREVGCRSWWLGTGTDNVAALSLYRSLGPDGETIVMFEDDL